MSSLLSSRFISKTGRFNGSSSTAADVVLPAESILYTAEDAYLYTNRYEIFYGAKYSYVSNPFGSQTAFIAACIYTSGAAFTAYAVVASRKVYYDIYMNNNSSFVIYTYDQTASVPVNNKNYTQANEIGFNILEVKGGEVLSVTQFRRYFDSRFLQLFYAYDWTNNNILNIYANYHGKHFYFQMARSSVDIHISKISLTPILEP